MGILGTVKSDRTDLMDNALLQNQAIYFYMYDRDASDDDGWSPPNYLASTYDPPQAAALQ
jgi:hypothetical protein